MRASRSLRFWKQDKKIIKYVPHLNGYYNRSQLSFEHETSNTETIYKTITNAALRNDYKEVKILNEYRDVPITNELIRIAIYNNNYWMTKLFLENKRNAIYDLSLVFEFACTRGNNSIIEMILEHKPRDVYLGLHNAILYKNIYAVRMILETTKPNLTDDQRRILLTNAIFIHDFDIVLLLTKHGFKCDYRIDALECNFNLSKLLDQLEK